ncbi:MAG: alpha/beta fold hydrolase [Clostridiales bacterium]|nr:alpha/beta fold hydrolase [Clostridiales bacterium]
MFIESDGIRLNAHLELPSDKQERCPLCIIIHGFTGNCEEPHLIAVGKTLRANGIATLRVDMYGHGLSGGTFEKHTLYKWLTNAMDVIDYAESLDFVTELYLCGHSQGGLLAMLLAGMEKQRIKLLMPLSPAVIIPSGAREGNLLGMLYDPDDLPPYLTVGDGRRLDINYVRVAQTLDLDKAIAAYRGRVFVAIGSKDATIPPARVKEAASKYESCTYVEIPGDTHCFDNNLTCLTEELDRFIKSSGLGSEIT